jgi:hypothetical protein
VRVRVRCTRSSDSFYASADFMQIEYVVDLPPETTIGSGPAPTTESRDASFSFSASEPGTTFECSLDGAAFAGCASPRNYTGLAFGEHEFRVRATDPGGNTDPTPASYTWTIVPPPCTGGTVTASADADSWVLQDSATQNHGTDSTLKVDSKSGANARTLVRFGLPALPDGCEVTNAKFRLYASSFKDGRTLQALRLGGSWTERAVNWNNQPATTGVAATATSASGYVEWTATSQVKGMYSGANNGFLVRDSVEGGNGVDQQFHSREKGTDNPPQLVITFG